MGAVTAHTIFTGPNGVPDAREWRPTMAKKGTVAKTLGEQRSTGPDSLRSVEGVPSSYTVTNGLFLGNGDWWPGNGELVDEPMAPAIAKIGGDRALLKFSVANKTHIGGEMKTTLYSAEWRLDVDALRETLTDDTEVLRLVSPSMPSGAVLNRDEWEAISELCQKHDV